MQIQKLIIFKVFIKKYSLPPIQKLTFYIKEIIFSIKNPPMKKGGFLTIIYTLNFKK